MYDELKDKGFEIVAVNAEDSEEQILKYIAEERFSFRIVMGGSGDQYTLGKAYGVEAYPTNYLVGPDGKILFRTIGFDEEAIRAALEKAGVK
jgi:hypothetical protein